MYAKKWEMFAKMCIKFGEVRKLESFSNVFLQNIALLVHIRGNENYII